MSIDVLEKILLQTRDTIFGQLRAIEDSCKAASERQRLQEISLKQITQMSGQNDRVDLSLTSRNSLIRSLLREISTRHGAQEHSLHEIEQSLRNYRTTGGRLWSQSLTIESATQKLLSCHYSQEEAIRAIERELCCPELDTSISATRSISRESEPMNTSYTADDTANRRATYISSSQRSRFGLIESFELHHSFCTSTCGCACHIQRWYRSPNCLDALLGSLFMGYRASPVFAQRCTSMDCKRRSRRFIYTYAFPQWFLKRVLLVGIMHSLTKGPELCLRIIRVRPYDSTIFSRFSSNTAANDTEFYQLQRALNDGEASVLDVNVVGRTILHVSLYLYL